MKLFWLIAASAVSGNKISLENALTAVDQRFSELQLARYDEAKFLKKKLRRITAKINRKKVSMKIE